MADASRTETYDVDIEKLYNTIVNYQDYPDFVDGVDEIEVLKSDASGALVRYSLNLIKEISYQLKMKHEKPHKVSWTFDSGDLFKTNSGSWQLKDLGKGKTEVTYSIDLDFKLMVPKMMLGKLASKNLPSMMDKMVAQAKKQK